jgi:hypothetical protein
MFFGHLLEQIGDPDLLRSPVEPQRRLERGTSDEEVEEAYFGYAQA